MGAGMDEDFLYRVNRDVRFSADQGQRAGQARDLDTRAGTRPPADFGVGARLADGARDIVDDVGVYFDFIDEVPPGEELFRADHRFKACPGIGAPVLFDNGQLVLEGGKSYGDLNHEPVELGSGEREEMGAFQV